MGMKPHEDVTLVDKSLFRKDLVVADTVYNPEKTKMILEAEEAGCKAIGGVGYGIFECVQDLVGYEDLCYMRWMTKSSTGTCSSRLARAT